MSFGKIVALSIGVAVVLLVIFWFFISDQAEENYRETQHRLGVLMLQGMVHKIREGASELPCHLTKPHIDRPALESIRYIQHVLKNGVDYLPRAGVIHITYSYEEIGETPQALNQLYNEIVLRQERRAKHPP